MKWNLDSKTVELNAVLKDFGMTSLNFPHQIHSVDETTPSANGKANTITFSKWFDENKQVFTRVDEALSDEISRKERAEEGYCYSNCFKAILDYKNFRYFEGFSWSYLAPRMVLHAWLVSKDNQVIDPTWIIGERRFRKQDEKSGIVSEKVYWLGSKYVGIEIPEYYVRRRVQKTGRADTILLDFFHSECDEIPLP